MTIHGPQTKTKIVDKVDKWFAEAFLNLHKIKPGIIKHNEIATLIKQFTKISKDNTFYNKKQKVL